MNTYTIVDPNNGNAVLVTIQVPSGITGDQLVDAYGAYSFPMVTNVLDSNQTIIAVINPNVILDN